jgi:ribonuclease D
MIKYASNDVVYLPKIYQLFKERIENNLFLDLTLKEIHSECQSFTEYPKINLNIKNFTKHKISPGNEVTGLLKYSVFI